MKETVKNCKQYLQIFTKSLTNYYLFVIILVKNMLKGKTSES